MWLKETYAFIYETTLGNSWETTPLSPLGIPGVATVVIGVQGGI